MLARREWSCPVEHVSTDRSGGSADRSDRNGSLKATTRLVVGFLAYSVTAGNYDATS
jgi:hypothetical protein